MQLRRYFERVQNVLYSNRGLAVEQLSLQEGKPGPTGLIRGRVRLWNDSLFTFDEVFAVRGVGMFRVRYAYHFQDSTGHLVFRYDNAAHHPEISTHPHHKHAVDSGTGRETIEPAEPPSLFDVLREIDRYLQA